jgi:hypothetical protein
MKLTAADLEDLLALTLWPEWVYAFLHFGKDIENRTWKPAQSMLRRWHAIHGGQAVGGVPARGDRFNSDHTLAVESMIDVAKLCGATVNKFTLSDVLRCRGIAALGYLDRVHPSPADRKGWHMPGCHGLHFSKIIALPEPIPCRGALGFWRVPDAQLHMIRDALRL